ncbi:CRISPR-associated protein Cas4 [Ignisphaera aggregans DSM 17230]|uniref:CRISPR-associated exonuclease Cas4 n=1 Tax=Ignisphaera aggregans (strain DSM 17230 / JCM 13409 / AQ1.S1) TaxID=583356 RepID=E0STX0_IGNAA|nr:CRISPR-associated protein Cas4 [Ignisphaera aggregans DSM 17230]
MELSSIEIPIVLIKEYVYCPRIAFYKYFMYWEPPTESMKFARYSKIDILKIVRGYGIDGDIYMEYPVKSRSLGIYGKIDIVIDNGKRVSIAEIKLETSRARLWRKSYHHLIQLTAYTIATEETFHKPIDRTFIVTQIGGEIIEINISPNLRRTTINIVEEFKKYIQQQKPPPKTPMKTRCNHCFYRKICV